MKSLKEECGESKVQGARRKRRKKTKFPSATACRRRAWETMRTELQRAVLPVASWSAIASLSRDMNLQVNFIELHALLALYRERNILIK